MVEEAGKTAWEGRQAGCCGGQGAVEGRVRWRAGSGGGPGRVAGRAGRLAGSGGGPGGRRGMNFQGKECSGVHIVTWNLRRIFEHLRRIFDFT